MEDGDDDFGDLYADVEVEASAAMSVAPQFSQLKFVNDGSGKRNNALIESGDKEERVSDGDDDDDDDDLNIVLNSDDDTIRHGDGSTIARTNTNLQSGELEDEDDDNIGTEEFAGGKAVGNSHSLYKYSRSQSAAYGSESKGSGCVASAYLSRDDNGYCQRTMGQRFSLPWSRSILDVNIDVFEQKPWKHPGADITNYFNFGLDEDSWKLYCNQLDEFRHKGSILSDSPASDPPELQERKGRAIEVEDSIVERQSSMDMRRQLDRDSDVIQITIVEPEEKCCGSPKEGSGHVPEDADNHGNVSGDHLSLSSASEDESFEGNQLEIDINAPKRVSKRRSSSSKPVTQGSENHESIRTSDNTKDTCTTDPSIVPAQSSEAEKSPQNHRKSFKDRWKSSSHETSSFSELTRSMKPGYHHSDDHRRYHSRRLDDKRYHSRCNSPPVYNNRTHKDFKPKPKPKFHHENDDIMWSRRPDEKRKTGEQRYHARRHGNPVYNNHRTYERMHPFDPYNEESVLYSKESDPPLDYYHGERFSGYEDYERFGPKMGRPVFRRSEEEEYYAEQRRYKYTDEFEWQDKRRVGNRGINDEFFLKRGYSDDMKGENLRYFDYNDREKDEFEDEYAKHKHVEYTRWEFRKKDDHFTEESYINNERWHDHMMPRSSSYGRERRYEEQMQLSERFRYDESFDRNNYTIDYDDGVDVARSRDHHWQSEMQWKEEEIMIPFEHNHVDDLYVEGRKCNFERVSNAKYEGSDEKRLRDSDVTRGGSYEWVFMGGVKSHDGSGYKRKREVNSGKKCRKSYGEKSGKKLSLSCRNSLDSRLLVQEGKSSKKHNKAIETKPINQVLEIQTKKVNNMGPTKHDTVAHVNERNMLDKCRILEARAKMEKRRARFNEATEKEQDSTTEKVTAVDLIQERGSSKPQRPARKRRWGGSSNNN
ncbi:hypothetical protein LXL04_015392 [Taraxacum kok-saghyz]